MHDSKYIKMIVDETCASIRQLLDQLDFSELSERNLLYKKYERDRYHYYVEMEKQRYLKVLDCILERDPHREKLKICDFGCMIPFLPTVLSRIGYQVTLVEKYEFYGQAFKESMSRFCEENSLEIADIDILNDAFDELAEMDMVLNLSVVEHFNGSPKVFINKVHGCLKEGGLLFFDVPNIANRVKRIRVLLGSSPLDDYSEYLEAPYPYMGHNREMTVKEVLLLMRSANFNVQHIETYDFNPYSTVTKLGRFVKTISSLIPGRDLGESILAVVNKEQG